MGREKSKDGKSEKSSKSKDKDKKSDKSKKSKDKDDKDKKRSSKSKTRDDDAKSTKSAKSDKTAKSASKKEKKSSKTEETKEEQVPFTKGTMPAQTGLQTQVQTTCVIHGKALNFYCENTESLICHDCTVMGPHNTQLHRISKLTDAFSYRF